METKSTGAYLRVIRKTNLMTQEQFSKKLNVHSQFVSNWERGLCLPPKHIWNKLKKYLDVHMFKGRLMRDHLVHIESEYK